MADVLPYGKQSIASEDGDAVTKALFSDFLTTGPSVSEFEAALCKQTGAKHAVACSNGTAALHLACMALNISDGDLGLTTPLTFLASANCIEYCGGKTDFVDIDENTLCLSPKKLEEYCRTIAIPKVVIPVDFAGVPANLAAIKALADKYGFHIIEDAAHSIGSTYSYEGAEYQCGSCTHTDLATFSFHPVKTITTGEGGAVLTNNDRLADRLRLFRNHGMTKDDSILSRKDGPWYYEMHELGFNFRITDLQCALGSAQIQKLESFKSRRQEIVRTYNKSFADNQNVIIPPWPEKTYPCFHLYPIRLTKGASFRLEAFEKLKEQGILCQIHYYPVHLQPYYQRKYGYGNGKCPVAEEYYESCISLPLYPAMSDSDVERVVEQVTSITS